MALKSAIEYIHALRDVLGDEFEPIKYEDDEDSNSEEPKSPSQSDSQTSINSPAVESIKNTEKEPASPESGIHSNETSVDYSVNPVGPIEALLFNSASPDMSGQLHSPTDNANPSLLENSQSESLNNAYPTDQSHFANQTSYNFENYDFANCSNLLQQLNQNANFITHNSESSSYTSFPFEF